MSTTRLLPSYIQDSWWEPADASDASVFGHTSGHEVKPNSSTTTLPRNRLIVSGWPSEPISANSGAARGGMVEPLLQAGVVAHMAVAVADRQHRQAGLCAQRLDHACGDAAARAAVDHQQSAADVGDEALSLPVQQPDAVVDRFDPGARHQRDGPVLEILHA